jgi:hypothetical protein
MPRISLQQVQQLRFFLGMKPRGHLDGLGVQIPTRQISLGILGGLGLGLGPGLGLGLGGGRFGVLGILGGRVRKSIDPVSSAL